MDTIFILANQYTGNVLRCHLVCKPRMRTRERISHAYLSCVFVDHRASKVLFSSLPQGTEPAEITLKETCSMIEISTFHFDNPRFLALLERQGEIPEEISATVSAIVEDVRLRKDEALFEYMYKYDDADLTVLSPQVTDEEFERAKGIVEEEFAEALILACRNLFKFHQHQLQHGYRVEYSHGVVLERKVKPINRVAVCVPAASAPLSSSLYMNVVPALVAGVPEIFIMAAPIDNRVNPYILYTADYLGVRTVYKISGAQGVAALAFGTESVPGVDKIVGPGNIYVQTAKKMVQGFVGIDSFAGPSEIAIIADNDAPDEYVAADMLSQAEHGTGLEASVLFCTSREQAERVRNCMIDQIDRYDLEGAVSPSLSQFGNIFIVDSAATAVSAVNLLAPEHVEIMSAEEESLAEQIVNAGAVFVGTYCPEPVGDYFCGTNHILPTGGTARFSSGLNVGDFLRSYSVVRYTRKALGANSGNIRALARPENMRAHMLSIEVRDREAAAGGD